MPADYTGYVPTPGFSPISIPSLPLLALTDEEKRLITRLQEFSRPRREHQMLCDAYYNGSQVIDNLEIAVPQKVADKLRTLVGWPKKAVDPYVHRLAVDGFRLQGATDADDELAELWSENGMDAEQSIAYTDTLALGSGYLMVGSNPDGDVPIISVESPLNMSVLWDATGRRARMALQTYFDGQVQKAAFVTPNQTVQVFVNDQHEWQIDYRDVHNFGRVPVHRLAHAPRSSNRDGVSAITPSVMSMTDAACRTLLGLEVAREVYSVPQKLILGAAESDFQTAEGLPRAAWDTYVNKVLALERDEDGNLPEFKQMQAYDPGVFTRLVEMYASQMASEVNGTPQEFGLYTQGNPTSAEAALVQDAQRDRTAIHEQRTYSPEIIATMQDALRFKYKGALPDKYRGMAVDWHDVAIATPAVTSDAVTKQIAVGSVPATSDVTLKRLGYSAIERKQLAQDNAEAAARAGLGSIVDLLAANAQKAQQAAPEAPVTPSASTSGPAAG